MDFVAYFDAALKSKGLTRAAFARTVGVRPQFLVSIRNGDRHLPPARVEAWADVLDLKGTDRRNFIIAALLPKCPELVRPYLLQVITGKGR